jgi:hypothetical protein
MPSILHKLVVALGLDATAYELGMKKAEGTAAKLGTKIGTGLKGAVAATFGAAALEELVRKHIELAGAIIDTSRELDISTKSLQEWGYAAKRNGVEFTKVEDFFKDLAILQQKALGGNKDAQDLFKVFGISGTRLSAPVDQLGRQIGEVFRQSNNPNSLLGAFKEISRSGPEIARIFSISGAGFDQMASDAERFGQILDEHVLIKLKSLQRQLQDMTAPGTRSGGLLAKGIQFEQDKWTLGHGLFEGVAAFVSKFWGGGSSPESRQAFMNAWNAAMEQRKQRDTAENREEDELKNRGKRREFRLPLGPKDTAEFHEFNSPLTRFQQVGAFARGHDPVHDIKNNTDSLPRIEKMIRDGGPLRSISNTGLPDNQPIVELDGFGP